MQPDPPERVIVISDIHMGADPGRGIFTAQKQLAAFVEHLAAVPERIDLVILGDALDYLQIEPYLDFSAAIAKKKTEAIVAHNGIVFAALRAFLGGGKRLIWCVGNHDLELVFKGAQEILVSEIVGASNSPTASQFVLRLDGGHLDYPLSNGGILRLVHGNKGDPWNDVDYAALATAARNGGADVAIYPPGSKLVAEVLNPLKAKGFVHVDLMKPETTVALPLTIALWPDSTIAHLKQAFPLFFATSTAGIKARLERAWKGTRPRFGRSPATSPARPAPEDLLALAFRDAFADPADPTGADSTVSNLATLLGEEAGAKRFSDALAAPSTHGKRFSGSWAKDLAASALRGVAYNVNQISNIWSTEGRDDLDAHVRGAFDGGIMVLVAGHTHLARAVSYASRYYLNTGTWANLMRIPTYFRGAEFHEHAQSLKNYLENPQQAPFELRPFQRLTYVDVDLRSAPDAPPFRADLREWIAEPSRVVGRFP